MSRIWQVEKARNRRNRIMITKENFGARLSELRVGGAKLSPGNEPGVRTEPKLHQSD